MDGAAGAGLQVLEDDADAETVAVTLRALGRTRQRDLLDGEFEGAIFPIIPGQEVSGEIVEIGNHLFAKTRAASRRLS